MTVQSVEMDNEGPLSNITMMFRLLNTVSIHGTTPHIMTVCMYLFRAVHFIMQPVSSGISMKGEVYTFSNFYRIIFCILYSTWSTEGVVLLSKNDTHYTCQSNHLTSFAVLVSATSMNVSPPYKHCHIMSNLMHRRFPLLKQGLSALSHTLAVSYP